MLLYSHSFEKEVINKKIALVLNITLIDNLIIFETLAIVNNILKGGSKLFSYKKYSELRDNKGLTDYEVSKNTNVQTSTLSNWKAGRYTPKSDKIKAIADYFGVSIEYFFED